MKNSRDLFNLNNLQTLLFSPISAFEVLGEVRVVNGRKHIFIDNGGDVLAICHLDVVRDSEHCHQIEIEGEQLVFATQHDDRLGAYTILSILPEFDINVDVLLTMDEEIGKSTGADFIPSKQYNWMFMFDRRGADAVTYMYNSKEWEDNLKTQFKIGSGSASCISKMEHLNCKAVNIGTGYHDEHTALCFASLDEWSSQVDAFVRFFEVNRNTFFPHEKKTYTYTAPVRHGIPMGRFDNDEVEIEGDHFVEDEEYFLDAKEWPKDVVQPVFCKFCRKSLIMFPSLYFIGICCDCEDDCYECAECYRWVQFGTLDDAHCEKHYWENLEREVGDDITDVTATDTPEESK